MLTHTIIKRHARTIRPLTDAPGLRQDGHRAAGFALVMHHNPAQRAIGFALAGIDGQIIADGGENAFLQQHAHQLIADFKLPLPKSGVAERHQPEIEQRHYRHDQQPKRQGRARDLPIGKPGRAHHHQFTVPRQAQMHE